MKPTPHQSRANELEAIYHFVSARDSFPSRGSLLGECFLNKLNNERLTPNAQRLRREMTKEEKHLWYDFLKDIPYTVNRQKVIGRYIADFYIAKAHLVIEIDGMQHRDEEQAQLDRARDAFMESQGIQVARYSNVEIQKHFQDVCQDIWNRLPEE